MLADPKKGPATARNIGLREATGDVIAFNDADDVWPRGKLALQLERLDREPPADVVAGLVAYFEELDRDTLAPAMSSRVETTFLHHVVSMVFRRSVFDRIGLFDETLMYGEDGDLFMRILEAEVPFVILNTPTLYYRRHGELHDDPRRSEKEERFDPSRHHVTRASAEIRLVARRAIVRPLLRGSTRAQVDIILVVIGDAKTTLTKSQL